jgi:hypothetical protein
MLLLLLVLILLTVCRPTSGLRPGWPAAGMARRTAAAAAAAASWSRHAMVRRATRALRGRYIGRRHKAVPMRPTTTCRRVLRRNWPWKSRLPASSAAWRRGVWRPR